MTKLTYTEAKTPAAKKLGFQIHALAFVVAIAVQAGINLLTGGYPWVLWVVLGWGIGLVAHGWAVAATTRKVVAN